jgi:hypothetical protein
MQLGQVIRRLSDGLRALWHDVVAWLDLRRAPAAGLDPLRSDVGASLRRRLRLLLIALPLLIALYYGFGALLMGRIDDDPEFTVSEKEILEGERYSVALAVGLLDRELNKHGWVANDPFFLPTALLDNMANYQLGIVAGLARFSNSLHRVLADAGVDDASLKAATVRLMRPGTVWLWDWSQPLKFIGRSESQYREALVSLESYNVSLAEGRTRFPESAAALRSILQHMMAGLGEASERLATTAESASALFSPTADDALYFAKGVAYANSILFKGLERDYAALISARKLGEDWKLAQAALSDSAALKPLFVMNGAPDAILLPSHLLNQGFRIFRARRALERVVAKLAA